MPRKRSHSSEKPHKIASVLSPIEWDFRGIKDDWEYPLAVMYEYARSSQLRIDLPNWLAMPFSESGSTFATHDELLRKFSLVRRSTLDVPTGEILEKLWSSDAAANDIFSALILMSQELPVSIKNHRAVDIALRFPRFPEPWQETKRGCGADYLKRRCAKWPRTSPPIREIRETSDPFDYAYLEPTWGRYDFIVDWTADADQIKEEFVKWLSRHHPGAQPGRRATWERLKWLSAYRLGKVAGLKYGEAIQFQVPYQSSGRIKNGSALVYPGYSSHTAWINAIESAEQSLDGNFCTDIMKSVGRLWIS